MKATRRRSGKQAVDENDSSLTASSRCQCKAALNGVMLSSSCWFDETNKSIVGDQSACEIFVDVGIAAGALKTEVVWVLDESETVWGK
jgi:hypothetical protein